MVAFSFTELKKRAVVLSQEEPLPICRHTVAILSPFGQAVVVEEGRREGPEGRRGRYSVEVGYKFTVGSGSD